MVPASASNIRLAMDRIKAEMASVKTQADIMTMGLLINMAKFVDYNSSFHIAAFTAILVGFHLFLRKGNLVLDSHTKFNPHEQLT